MPSMIFLSSTEALARDAAAITLMVKRAARRWCYSLFFCFPPHAGFAVIFMPLISGLAATFDFMQRFHYHFESRHALSVVIASPACLCATQRRHASLRREPPTPRKLRRAAPLSAITAFEPFTKQALFFALFFYYG